MYYSQHFCVVKTYGKSYRNVDMSVPEGKITVIEPNVKTICKVAGNQVVEVKQWENGCLKKAIKWGEYEKELKDGTVYKIMRYRKGTARGKHGLCVRNDFELFGFKGKCYTFFSRGKMIWQRFIYPNKKQAYYIRWTHTHVKGKYPNGERMFEIKTNSLYTRDNKEGEPFLYHTHSNARKYNYSTDGLFCEYTFWNSRGRVRDKGTFENNQRVGEWVENYRKYFYVSGVVVDKKLYDAKPEDINAKQVLRTKNVQERAMLLKKVGMERLVNECNGKIIDRYRNYELIDFPIRAERGEENDRILRILKVVCPSTRGNYFLRVPPTDDFKTCLSARNGTFTGFEPQAKRIDFDKET